MAANNNCPQTPPLNKQVPIITRLGIEFPLALPEQLTQQEMTTSLAAPDEKTITFMVFIIEWKLKR